MPRLLFEKKGNAVWISHLDLMRLFQRAFKRAGLPLTHTQGFNPRPSVSIALPLSVGVESSCELLDFDLDGDLVSTDTILARLNNVLVDGIRVLAVYNNGRKIRDLSLLKCKITLTYDDKIPDDAEEKIRALFARSNLVVQKNSKRNGVVDQDIIPMIRSIKIERTGEKELSVTAFICCQNPTLNPTQITQAIALYLPEYQPSHCMYSRLEVYDSDEVIFR